jgi:hypothetical protein
METPPKSNGERDILGQKGAGGLQDFGAAVGDDRLRANARYRMTLAHASLVVGLGDPGHGGRPA